jgi:hypothetical protein
LKNEDIFDMGRDNELIDKVIQKYIDILPRETDQVKAIQLLQKFVIEDDEFDYVK